MDRIINVKVGGNFIYKDNKNAGVRGEANVTILRLSFDESWDNFAKTITFWDARGTNPVKITLATTLLENIVDNTQVYLVPIPAEPMAEAGNLTFVIDGYIDDKIQRSMSDKLVVKDAPMADNAGNPVEPTPDQITQFQSQIDKIISDIQQAFIARNEAKASAEGAESAKLKADEAAGKAELAVGKTSYVGDNGNWYAWDGEKCEFYDTKVKAQAGSTVYVGDNPPDDADVWINPKGEPLVYVTIEELRAILAELTNVVTPTPTTITLYANRWVQGESATLWYQVLDMKVPAMSKVDLQPNPEQLCIFHEKDLAFVAENDEGTVTVFCIGQKPANDYEIQATITEVTTNG
mgnify:CR=1 FL=1